MKKMKRVAANSHHAEASARSKKQRLLEDYLELQKDFVSKKKKLQIAKQKKEILLAEVRFLKRKHKSFRIQSEAHEHEQDLVGPQKSYARSKLLLKTRSDSVLKSPSPAPDFNPVMGNEEQDIRKKEEANLKPPRVEKKPKNCLFNKKRVGKKKTSWQDPVGLQPSSTAVNLFQFGDFADPTLSGSSPPQVFPSVTNPLLGVVPTLIPPDMNPLSRTHPYISLTNPIINVGS